MEIKLTDTQLRDHIDVAVQDALASRGLADPAVSKQLSSDIDADRKYGLVRSIFDNDGYDCPEEKFRFTDKEQASAARMTWTSLRDALGTQQFNHLLPRVVSTIVREAVEPELTLTRLLRPIRFNAGTHAVFPAMGAMSGVADMPEGAEYPELQRPDMSGEVHVHMGKVGTSVRVTEEVLRYSQWDIMGIMLRGAGRALARHKEQKVANLILDGAQIAYDNDTPGGAAHGSTTGRAIDGTFNNTLRLDDLFVVYADLVNDGFIPNTLLMNALGWLIFARDPSMRAFNFVHGGPLMKTQQGAGPIRPSWDPNMGPRPGTAEQLSNKSQYYVDVPNLFPAPLGIVVSPFITHDAANNKTDMVMCDREELGLILIDEEPQTEDFDDPYRDIRITKIRERYGLALLNNGYAARKIANLSTARGYDFEDTKTVWDVQGGALPT